MRVGSKLDPYFPGRIYGPEWSIENVARRLRFEADRGFLRFDDERDVRYRQKCSARHIGSGCSVIFTRDDVAAEGGVMRGWHASICFIGEDRFEDWNDQVAERWLAALFGADRPRVQAFGSLTEVGLQKGVRHFLLDVERW